MSRHYVNWDPSYEESPPRPARVEKAEAAYPAIESGYYSFQPPTPSSHRCKHPLIGANPSYGRHHWRITARRPPGSKFKRNGNSRRRNLNGVTPSHSLASLIFQVLDADEEVFLLYTSLASSSSLGGLGSVDPRHDDISLSLEIAPQRSPNSSFKKPPEQESKVIDVLLAQDTTSLRSRKGDTGSVLWRASVELARTLLKDQYFPSTSGAPLLDPDMLRQVHVLELGSGTGLLGILLSPFVSHYTLSDLPYLLPLIQKNIARNSGAVLPVSNSHKSPPRTSGIRKKAPHAHPNPNPPPSHHTGGTRRRSTSQTLPPFGLSPSSNCTVSPLDWIALAATPAHSSARARARAAVLPPDLTSVDLILAVDTIYNVSLIPSFISVLDEFARSGPGVGSGSSPVVENKPSDQKPATVVLIVCELRDEDVMRAFLDAWLSLRTWEIWHVGGNRGENADAGAVSSFLEGPFVAWVGYKVTSV
ncbi:hypothetical protein BS47DRAFT_1381978 [Hydnum rufescens UP504]|uniref:Uncharacterized protein n=1 Tax=Hydnum rufescens UP504 TaxID=1448309 RepID=A0A9P6AYQ4_9AGAM|nr:hypothetical protein BS47DRAFT_1381978 [Hydnum rufescens UP504]